MKIDKMGLAEDSRPFTVLRENAEEFKSLFNGGIEKCLAILDSGISTLLCDPDSLLGPSTSANRLSAHMEFSKAKYELFVKMREYFEKFESECVEHIAEMKELFLENVEIFLAGTKLEVKLPTPETLSEIEKKRSPGSKGRSGNSPLASSLYPKLLDSAKKQISRFSSLLPNADNTETIEDDDGENQQSVATPVRQNGKSPKRVTIVTPQEMEILVARGAMENSAVIDISEESDEEPAVVEVTSKKSGRKPANSTPASQKKIPTRATRNNPTPSASKEISSDNSNNSKLATPVRRRNTKASEKEVNENNSVDLKDMEDSLPQVEIKGRRATRSQLATPTVSTPSSTSGRKTRTPRRKANSSEDSLPAPVGPKTSKSVHFSADIESSEDSAIQKSPKEVRYTVGMDITEDLDVYSPDVKLSKSTPRRKTTILGRAMDNFDEMNLTPDTSRGKSKRKTIAGPALDEIVAPSPKRLKMGRRSNIMPSTSSEDEPMDSNFLAGDEASEQGHYSPWMPLSDISGSVPSQPGIYELKVAAAKKPAYIGGCDSLRQKLTLHKLKQNSGHKHLDKFIDRNLSNILVRYEQLSSSAVAKSEEKIRVKAFVDRFKNTPAYN